MSDLTTGHSLENDAKDLADVFTESWLTILQAIYLTRRRNTIGIHG